MVRIESVQVANVTIIGRPSPSPTNRERGQLRALSTSDIEAIRADGQNYNPADGNPGFFGSVIDPSDVFNYIHDQLEPTGDGHYLVPVDRNNYPGNGDSGRGGRPQGLQRHTVHHSPSRLLRPSGSFR